MNHHDAIPLEFLRRCGLDADRDLDVMSRLQKLLADGNEQLNLTRLDDPADFWIGHVADSLAVALACPDLLTERLRVADVGTGGGFPMLPLAWANPRLSVTGIESSSKKTRFVAVMLTRLGLYNCSVLDRQAREAGRLEGHAGGYDAVVSRAVAESGRLIRDCRQLLADRPGTRLIFYKTPAAVADELAVAQREAAKYKLQLDTSDVITLPGNAGERQFIIASRV